MDKISIDRAKLLHPKVRDEVLDILVALEKRNVNIRITQGLRTFAEQEALYARGRTASGAIVTNAKGGQSYHNYGLAVDFCLIHKDGKISYDMAEDMDHDGKKDWMEVVEEFEKRGWHWGGYWKFKDTPHFEKTFGLNFVQLYKLKLSHQVDGNDYVTIPGL